MVGNGDTGVTVTYKPRCQVADEQAAAVVRGCVRAPCRSSMVPPVVLDDSPRSARCSARNSHTGRRRCSRSAGIRSRPRPRVSVVPRGQRRRLTSAPWPIKSSPSRSLNAAVARASRNPAGRRRAEIGEDREDLVVVVRIRCRQAHDRTGIDHAVVVRSRRTG